MPLTPDRYEALVGFIAHDVAQHLGVADNTSLRDVVRGALYDCVSATSVPEYTRIANAMILALDNPE